MKRGKLLMLLSGISLVLVLAALPFMAACAEPAPAPTPAPTPAPVEGPKDVVIRMHGFFPGTSAQMRSDAMAEALRLEYPDWRVTSSSIRGEAEGIQARLAGEYEFYNATNVWTAECKGQQPYYPDIDYEKVLAHSAVIPVAQSYVCLLTHGKTGLTCFKDIVDKKYPTRFGASPGTPQVIFETLLGAYGLTLEDLEAWGGEWLELSLGRGPGPMEKGDIDSGLTIMPVPQPAYMGVTFDLSLLPIEEPKEVKALEELGMYKEVIPASAYPWLKNDIPTLSFSLYLAANPNLPEDIVYYATKAFWEQKDVLIASYQPFEQMLEPANMMRHLELINKSGVPTHPGALKFFREMGWIK